MGEIFGERYADMYDVVYAQKPYDAEVDLLMRSFSKAEGPVGSVLDLGCGTGEHSIRLARAGLTVVGVDRSWPMLSVARAKTSPSGIPPLFLQADVRGLPLRGTFDVATLMFAVLCYQTSNSDVLATLTSIRGSLRAGGLLVGDIWYGPAVLRTKPEERFRVFETGDRELHRLSKGRLDTSRHVCVVELDQWLFEHDHLLFKGREIHEVRFFFPQELALFLELAGFDIVSITAFPDDDVVDDSHWNAFFVARARAL